MRHLWKLRLIIRPYWFHISLTLVLLLGMTALNLVIPQVIRQVIDVGLVQKQANYLIRAALVILGIAVLRALLRRVDFCPCRI